MIKKYQKNLDKKVSFEFGKLLFILLQFSIFPVHNMLQLTDEQKKFIEKHEIPLSWVIDATGIVISNETGKPFDISRYGDFRRKYDKQKLVETMEKYDKHFLVNWKNCQKDITHDIRDKHCCVMCNTRSIVEIKRHYNEGFIYIAVSKSESVIKIGTTSDIEYRKRTLNETCYGNISDWQVAYFVKTSEKAGEIEKSSQNLLSKYLWNAEYMKNGRNRSAYELVKCDYKTVKTALDEVKRKYPTSIFIYEWEMLDAEQLFNFGDTETNSKRTGNKQETNKPIETIQTVFKEPIVSVLEIQTTEAKPKEPLEKKNSEVLISPKQPLEQGQTEKVQNKKEDSKIYLFVWFLIILILTVFFIIIRELIKYWLSDPNLNF